MNAQNLRNTRRTELTMVVSAMDPKLLIKMLQVTFTGGPAERTERRTQMRPSPRRPAFNRSDQNSSSSREDSDTLKMNRSEFIHRNIIKHHSTHQRNCWSCFSFGSGLVQVWFPLMVLLVLQELCCTVHFKGVELLPT